MSIKTYSRQNPYTAYIQERRLLSGIHSTKQTYHLALAILGDLFPFHVGDSIGIMPQNDPDEVAAIIKKIGCNEEEEILDRNTNKPVSIATFLLNQCNISRINTSLFKTLSPNDPLLLPEKKEDCISFLHTHTLLDCLKIYDVSDVSYLSQLMPLLPRFYSIANSSLLFPNEIHLLVAHLSYRIGEHLRYGVGSSFLCHRATLHLTPIPIYLQPSNHFSIPKDPNASIILVGPGTGVAPFRAFLQERLALRSAGRNWLFFGERNSASDFYYESFWNELVSSKFLYLDLAFSRDSLKKVYVQDKLYEKKKDVWTWLEEGAYFYVCGDAEKMAKDVQAVLLKIICEEGKLSEENGRLYLKQLRAKKRYLIDVY